jgi:hypothetical protein
VLRGEGLTLPWLSFCKARKTLPTLPVDGELPSASLVQDPDGADACLETGDVEHAIAHACEGLAEPNSPRVIATGPERQRRLAAECQFVEVSGSDLGRTEAVPPLADEHTPDRALPVGGFQHLVDIAEESGHPDHIEHAAHDRGPSLEAADGLAPARHTCRDPSAA